MRVRVGFVLIIGKISAGVTDNIIMGWQLTGKRIPVHVHVGSPTTWPSSKEQNIFAYRKLWYGNIAHLWGVSFNKMGEYSYDSQWAKNSIDTQLKIWFLSILHVVSRLLVVLIPRLCYKSISDVAIRLSFSSTQGREGGGEHFCWLMMAHQFCIMIPKLWAEHINIFIIIKWFFHT